jgi:hypothetical protein
MKKDQTKKLGSFGADYNALVAPIIKEASTTRGFIAEVTRQLSGLLKREVARQQVDLYLHSDKDKRVEPSYSTGVALLKAVELARKEMAKA